MFAIRCQCGDGSYYLRFKNLSWERAKFWQNWLYRNELNQNPVIVLDYEDKKLIPAEVQKNASVAITEAL